MGLLLFACAPFFAGPRVAGQETDREPIADRAAGRDAQAVAEDLVHPPAIRLELAASEPEVVDPVAIRFDHRGRMWVVEMRDYPFPQNPDQPPRGRIRVLQDADDDGHFETVTTFADQLRFPTGLQPWKNGVIVTLAGQIAFFADDDGDLQSDRSEVWFTGFAEQNEQLRANHPTLGPDGLVYVAGGLRGGTIVSQDPRWEASEPLELQGFDFAFDPHGQFWGRVTGNSQYGLTIDDFGTRIGCSNRNPAIEAVLPIAVVQQVAGLTPKDALNNAALVGPDSEVRSIANAWTTSNLHAGQFSAACGVLRGAGPGLPASWRGDLFVCEPTSYVVQRQQVQPDGPVLQARRNEGIECAASRDEWFRPVDLAHGPDGCIYIVDMARAVIEHPDWMPTELKQRADLRWGETRGRIWRMAAADWQRTPLGTPPNTETQTLQWLGDADPWRRSIATQWLYETPAETSTLADLQGAIWQGDAVLSAAGRARAVQCLAAHEALDEVSVKALLQSPDARLRRLALRLRSSNLSVETLVQFTHDDDAGVRFQAAVALVLREDLTASGLEALAKIAGRDAADPWFAKILTALSPESTAQMLPMVLEMPQADLPIDLLVTLAQRAAQSQAVAFDPVLTAAADDDESHSLAVVAGWCRAIQRGKASVSERRASLDPAAQTVLDEAFERAPSTALDRSQSLQRRSLAVAVLAATPERLTLLRPLLDAEEAPPVRADVLPRLLQHDASWTLAWLDESLTGLSPSLRATAISGLLRDTAASGWLLERVESGKLTPALIGLNTIDRLKRSSNVELRRRAGEAFRAIDADRQQTLARYRDAAQAAGDAVAGRALFRQHCAVCHRVENFGTDVGPDISDSRTKTPEALLTAILSPNAAIDAAYLRYTVLTVDGTVVDGLLLSDSGDSVVVQVQGGERRTFARDEIESISTSGVSLMPEGFEQLLSVDSMRDLVSYLKNWRYLDGSIPLPTADRP